MVDLAERVHRELGDKLQFARVWGGKLDGQRVAREFEGAGAKWIHVVDLDAARTGTRAHLDQIRLIVRAVACRIEVGGGVRTAEAAFELLDAGVERVVVGTAAVERPELADTFRVRDVARDVLLCANIGAAQLNLGYGVDQERREGERKEGAQNAPGARRLAPGARGGRL